MRPAAAILALAAFAGAARADPCAPQQIRWLEDCSALAGQPLTGVDRLRYLAAGEGWVTMGGEARVRIERIDPADLGAAGGPSFLQVGRRAMLHADYHLSPHGPRVFGQVMALGQDGRKPGPRAQDEDRFDIAQLFVEAPARLGPAILRLRYGRQEVDLRNRLVNTRDGVTVRRTFQGPLATLAVGGATLTAFRLHPTAPRRGVLDDRADRNETFEGLTLDGPAPLAGQAGLFLFERRRPATRWLSSNAAERRMSGGLRYAAETETWSLEAQATAQWGDAGAQSIRAFGVTADAAWRVDARHDVKVGPVMAYASGDGRPGDRRLGTFDPTYPSNNGVTDAPFLFQTNYLALGGDGSFQVGPAELGLAGFRITRASTGDAVYAQGRPVAGLSGGGRATARLVQLRARIRPTPHLEAYLSVTHAWVGDTVRAAGGRNATYARGQFTAYF